MVDSPEFAEAVRQVLTDFLGLPQSFLDYTVQYAALNPLPIPISQITGWSNVVTGVSTVYGRSGAVTAQSGDYTAGQVTNAADKGSSSTQSFAAPIKVASATTLFSGSGAPSGSTGSNGDYYFRTDTPGTANQRIYVKSAGAWTGIV